MTTATAFHTKAEFHRATPCRASGGCPMSRPVSRTEWGEETSSLEDGWAIRSGACLCPVLDSLCRLPSRASAAAIGHGFVLNDWSGPEFAMIGLDALSEMVCDWSVAIFEETINQTTLNRAVRRYALRKLHALVALAVDRDYQRISKESCCELVKQAEAEMEAQENGCPFKDIQAVEDLCNHLNEAIEGGVFERLPDF